MISIKIGTEEAGSRLDRIVRKRLSLMSLSEIYSLLRKGGIRVGGKKAKQDQRVIEGDQIDIDVDSSEDVTPAGPDQSLRTIVRTEFFKHKFKIIYEDDDLLACNKPSGLVVHPGTGHLHRDTLIELATGYLLEKGNLKEGEEPALVHRLDRDTSGVILIAKNKRVVRQLNEVFRTRDVVKQYIAICHNRPPEHEGVIAVEMARTHEQRSGTKMRVEEGGQFTRSRYRVLAYNNKFSRIEVFLDTGKTHQIRVHMAHSGAPVIGDERYGSFDLDKEILIKVQRRLYLHAHYITFPHPSKGKKITIEAPEPIEFKDLMVKF
jgi:RluA family pseudouridine synthase